MKTELIEGAYTNLTGGTTPLCDRCGRDTKGNFIIYAGAKICGVCQWEKYHGKVED